MTNSKTAAAIMLISSTVSCAGPGPSAGYERSQNSMGKAAAIRPAPMDPERKIFEQDCSKPVELYSGNLRCK